MRRTRVVPGVPDGGTGKIIGGLVLETTDVVVVQGAGAGRRVTRHTLLGRSIRFHIASPPYPRVFWVNRIRQFVSL